MVAITSPCHDKCSQNSLRERRSRSLDLARRCESIEGAQPAEQALQPKERMPKVAAFMPDADEVLEFAREHRVSSIIFIGLTLVLLEWVKARFSPARDLAQQARMKRMFKKGAIKAKKR